MTITDPSSATTMPSLDAFENNHNYSANVIIFAGEVTVDQIDLAVTAGDKSIRQVDGIYILDKSLYLAADADIRKIRNITIDLNGNVIYIHRSRINHENTVWNDVLFIDHFGTGGTKDFVQNGGTWQAVGGGFIERGSSGSRWIIGGKKFNNVRIASEEYVGNNHTIRTFTLTAAGEYSGIEATDIEAMQTGNIRAGNDRRLLLHDCKFSTRTARRRCQIRNDGNSNVMLNDCEFISLSPGTSPNTPYDTTYPSWLQNNIDEANSPVQANTYFMGTTADLWETYPNTFTLKKTQRRFHTGSIKYYQVYLDGVYNDFKYSVWSQEITSTGPEVLANAESRLCIPTIANGTTEPFGSSTTRPSMLTDSVGATIDGKINIALIKSINLYNNGSWDYKNFKNHRLIIRSPEIDFTASETLYSDDQRTESLGRADVPIPLPLVRDMNYEEPDTVPLFANTFQYNFNTKIITISHNQEISIAELYHLMKDKLSEHDYHNTPFEWTIEDNGKTLNLNGWSINFITAGGHLKRGKAMGTGVIVDTVKSLMGTITVMGTPTNANERLTLIDSTGVPVSISTEIADMRVRIDIPSESPDRRNLAVNTPIDKRIRSGVTFTVLAKADGYRERLISHLADDGDLVIELTRDTEIDTGILLTGDNLASRNLFGIQYRTTNTDSTTIPIGDRKIEITMTLGSTTGELSLTKRIVDHLLKENAGLDGLYEAGTINNTVTDDRVFSPRFSNILIHKEKLDIIKVSGTWLPAESGETGYVENGMRPDTYAVLREARMGSPVLTRKSATDSDLIAYQSPANDSGQVTFDNEANILVQSSTDIADGIEITTTDQAYLDAIKKPIAEAVEAALTPKLNDIEGKIEGGGVGSFALEGFTSQDQIANIFVDSTVADVMTVVRKQFVSFNSGNFVEENDFGSTGFIVVKIHDIARPSGTAPDNADTVINSVVTHGGGKLVSYNPASGNPIIKLKILSGFYDIPVPNQNRHDNLVHNGKNYVNIFAEQDRLRFNIYHIAGFVNANQYTTIIEPEDNVDQRVGIANASLTTGSQISACWDGKYYRILWGSRIFTISQTGERGSARFTHESSLDIELEMDHGLKHLFHWLGNLWATKVIGGAVHVVPITEEGEADETRHIRSVLDGLVKDVKVNKAVAVGEYAWTRDETVGSEGDILTIAKDNGGLLKIKIFDSSGRRELIAEVD